MAFGVVNECSSCLFLFHIDGALAGAGEVMFNAMSSPISKVLSGFMVVVLLFQTQIRGFLKIMNSEIDNAYILQEIYSNSGRLAVVAMSIGLYDVWHDWVVGSLNLIILSIAQIVMSSVDSLVMKDAIISGKSTAADDFNLLFSSPEDTQLDAFADLMRRVYNASYSPINTLNAAMKPSEAGFIDKIIGSAASIRVSISIWVLNLYAAISNTLFMIILVLHRIMTELVAGLGPLIMGLWVFKATQHYAYALIKMLLATGSSVIAASFLMSLALSVVTKTMDEAAILTPDGEDYKIDQKKLSEFVFSADFLALENAYLMMMFMMVLAAIIAITTLLGQKPSLEK